jgi:hypothetical protein
LILIILLFFVSVQAPVELSNEAIQELRSMFDTIDLDNCGSVSHSDLRSALKKHSKFGLGIGVKTRVDTVFNILDHDNDGWHPNPNPQVKKKENFLANSIPTNFYLNSNMHC